MAYAGCCILKRKKKPSSLPVGSAADPALAQKLYAKEASSGLPVWASYLGLAFVDSLLSGHAF